MRITHLLERGTRQVSDSGFTLFGIKRPLLNMTGHVRQAQQSRLMAGLYEGAIVSDVEPCNRKSGGRRGHL